MHITLKPKIQCNKQAQEKKKQSASIIYASKVLNHKWLIKYSVETNILLASAFVHGFVYASKWTKTFSCFTELTEIKIKT